MNGGAFINTVIRRPRLLIAVGVGLVAFWLAPHAYREATRALIGWNAGAWVFIALIAQMMFSGGDVRAHAAQEDERPAVLLVIAVGAALMALAAIVWELGPVKDMKGADKALHLTLVGVTILSSWAYIHLMFAMHYAAQYYSDSEPGGLLFPQCEAPAWGEFCYQSFVIGCACATADVNLTSPGVRVVCLIQGIIAFFFNTIILALTINIGSGLF
jgi:uncharacterized membrane protein